MEILNLSSKATETIGKVTAISTGILAWETAVTAKFVASNADPGYSLFSIWRFGDALSCMVGDNLAHKILGPGNFVGPAKPKLDILGVFNKTTFTGAAILIANSIAKELIPMYKKLDLVTEIVQNAGIGITVGGAVGGIFDPEPSGNRNNSTNYPSAASGSGARRLTFHN